MTIKCKKTNKHQSIACLKISLKNKEFHENYNKPNITRPGIVFWKNFIKEVKACKTFIEK